jgi:hypothetical protein
MPGIEPSQSQRGEGGPIPSVAAKKPSVAVAEPSLNAPWYSREYATAANMSDKNGLELERGRAAGASGIPSNDPVRRLAVSGTVSTGMAPDAPVAQMAATTPATTPVATTATAQSQTAKVGMPGANVAAPGTVESPIVAKPNQSVQQAAKQADMQAGQTATTAMQQPLGKDIGFGIRKLDMPDGSSMYMGEGPNPSLPSASGIAYAPVARQINMPVLNRGMGVFSSMADFANQAGKAYGAIAQNKSDNKSARIGMDVVKMNSDISQNALKLGMDQQRADSDMGLNAVKQAQANLQNNSMSALESARQEYLAAGDDPAKQQAAARKLRAFGVLDKNDSLKDNFLVVGGEQQYDQNGNRISDTPRVAIDLRTMQPIGLGQGAAGQQAAKPSAKNIEALKSDPSLAAAFDQQFGAGASKQYIQGK